MKRVYENKQIRIFWDSDKCTHIGPCVKKLPQVFNRNRRPWVDVNAARAEDIMQCIDACPSGALRYEMPDLPETEITTIRVLKDGPYRIGGKPRLIDDAGKVIKTEGAFCLCRCGQSKKMPFCDGTHLYSGFKDKVEKS